MLLNPNDFFQLNECLSYKLHPYSILTGHIKVESVAYQVLSLKVPSELAMTQCTYHDKCHYQFRKLEFLYHKLFLTPISGCGQAGALYNGGQYLYEISMLFRFFVIFFYICSLVQFHKGQLISKRLSSILPRNEQKNLTLLLQL